MLVFDEILQSPNLREIIDELEAAWADEQKRRHEFWADIDENIKAEFIMGEIIYGVPQYLDSLFTIVVVKFSFFASFFLLLISVEKWISYATCK